MAAVTVGHSGGQPVAAAVDMAVGMVGLAEPRVVAVVHRIRARHTTEPVRVLGQVPVRTVLDPAADIEAAPRLAAAMPLAADIALVGLAGLDTAEQHIAGWLEAVVADFVQRPLIAAPGPAAQPGPVHPCHQKQGFVVPPA